MKIYDSRYDEKQLEINELIYLIKKFINKPK